MTCVWVALGGAMGSVGRLLAGAWIERATGTLFPWGTLAVNVSGALLIGFAAAALAPSGRWGAQGDLRVFLMTGICGGYTTFSAFSLQTLTLMRAGQSAAAAGYVVLSVGLCLLAVWVGTALGRGLSA